jgi:putative ABC transport system substrate-binding protein
MKRREFITVLGGAAVWPLAARAQQRRLPVLGFLSPHASSDAPVNVKALTEGLAAFGYRDGETIRIEYRWAELHFERLPQLAAELVQLPVDIIATDVTQASLAAKAATSTIPVVMIGVSDPVGVGLAASLAHPGGNVTGTSSVATAMAAKPLEALKDVVPGLRRVGIFWNSGNAAFQRPILREAEAAARQLGLDPATFDVHDATDIDRALAAMQKAHSEALYVLADPVIGAFYGKIAELAARAHLPTASYLRNFAEAGGLMAYGPSSAALWRRTGYYVDRILKGDKPADLPIEQPTMFEFLINLKTAAALGITVPPTLLARADEVLE